MKHMKWISALMLLLIPLMAAAQVQTTGKMTVPVPFKFAVGDVTMPAGEVTLQRADSKGWVLAICNPDAKLSIYSLAVPGESKELAATSELVFRKYGDRYFLTSVRIGDSHAVYELRPGKLENEMRAQNVTATQVVLLASLR